MFLQNVISGFQQFEELQKKVFVELPEQGRQIVDEAISFSAKSGLSLDDAIVVVRDRYLKKLK